MNVAPAFAEDAVLGGLLLDNTRLHEVAPLLSPDHFTSAARRALYAAIHGLVLAGDPADAVTIGEQAPELAELAIELASNTPSAASVPAYAELVRESWRRREAVNIAAKLSSEARNGEAGAVDAALAALMALNTTAANCEFTGKQALRQAWEQTQEAYEGGGKLPGITTGLTSLDGVLGGWHDSDLTIIGARPAMGKTAFMLNLAVAAATAGNRPGIISAEQPAQQLGLRLLSAASGVKAASLRAGKIQAEEWAQLQEGMRAAIAREMWIYDRSALSLDELTSVARKWKHTHGIGVLFVDYAQRITVPGAERNTEVAKVARGLKDIARALQVPVVALAQVKAGVEARTDKRPNAGDLANSDELTREADQVLMLYRDDVYNRDKPHTGIAEVLVEKNRHGPTGCKRLRFDAATMQFTDQPRNEF